MSDEHKDFLEDNTAALMRAGFARDAQPGAEAVERTYALLAADLRARSGRAPDPAIFPDWLLGGLAAMLVLVALWLGEQYLAAGAASLSRPPVLAASLLLAANLALAPVAGAVIVMRRRHVW